jgi:GntR family transcriptional regulator, rspAB operon transcriptional repressor
VSEHGEDGQNDSQSFGRTTAAVLEHIVFGLSSGQYSPGEKLNAALLCRDLGLSKAPVREALHVLAGEGVLNLSTNRGAFIRALGPDDLIKLWEAFAVAFGYELRAAAAGVGAADAATRLGAAMAAIRDCQPGADFVRGLNHFHDVVSSLVDNPYIVASQTRRLGEFWIPYILSSIPLANYINCYIGNYQRIHDCLIVGDGASAESCFHYHAHWSAAIIAGARPDPQAPWIDMRGSHR